VKSDPVRGEVWLADLGFAGKIRPVLVVSAPLGEEDYALLAVVPCTTSDHASRYAVEMAVPSLRPGKFNVQGLMNVPLSKFMRRLTVLGDSQMRLIDAAIKQWLCLR
jgi:mRNA interferase MazF